MDLVGPSRQHQRGSVELGHDGGTSDEVAGAERRALIERHLRHAEVEMHRELACFRRQEYRYKRGAELTMSVDQSAAVGFPSKGGTNNQADSTIYQHNHRSLYCIAYFL